MMTRNRFIYITALQIRNSLQKSPYYRVLGMDWTRKAALVEPNVRMDMLVNAILPHRYIPPVVMEYLWITVGGGFAGTSGESSSVRAWFL